MPPDPIRRAVEEAARIGFTGTREGMTALQAAVLSEVLSSASAWFHHGDCVGADDEADGIAKRHRLRIFIHPPADSRLRAFCHGDATAETKGFLERNQDIVDATHVLIATPDGFAEVLRSGTWSTIRYARRQRKPHLIIWPDGSVTDCNGAAAVLATGKEVRDGN